MTYIKAQLATVLGDALAPTTLVTNLSKDNTLPLRKRSYFSVLFYGSAAAVESPKVQANISWN